MRNQAPSGIRPSTSGDPSAPASMTQHTSIALPYDIWNEIVHLAAKDDLIQLCLVSAMVGRIATKRLYASLSLNTMVNTAKCYRTVMGSSTLAGTVTELELDLMSSRPLRKVRLPLLGMYATSLPQIVGALPDLIELTLSVETRYGDELTHLVSAEGLEAFRRFSQLQTFEFIVKFRVHDTSIFEEEIRRACPTLQSVAVHGRESEESSDEEEWEEGDEEEDGDEEDGDEEDGEESWYDEEHLDEESLPFGL
ncbi:hypothetical protein DACRYDRAFT_117888 [Dacryopinax primogenitus]|uniref:Uncharacterized protein n=1 Tax=Dacryopinax primogenitus (strain DJM 731) TaxID=1858805 RepID=M5FRG1_DACPD|nr:uncharacterized protein DACRYDRAFT_117888 [Dacryopinax primogenitus]EJT99705.1 hypothetical protein DACRYDRAFT_117888 [Dacryopinax primogenitus]